MRYRAALFFARALHFERAESELRGTAGEEPLAQFAQEAVFGIQLRDRGAVDMGALAFVALDQALLGHDL